MIFPLTKGLLVSMALRSDHSFGIDKPIIEGLDPRLQRLISGHTDQTRLELLLEMKDVYNKIVTGEIKNNDDYRHLFEEIHGEGFYSPAREDYYLSITSLPIEL